LSAVEQAGGSAAVPGIFSAQGRLKWLGTVGAAPALKAEASQAQVVVHRTPGKLEIDSTVPRREIGYYTPLDLLYDTRDFSVKQGQRGISDTVSKGDQLAQPTGGRDMIGELAFERMFVDYNDHRFALVFVPRTPPKISITPPTTTIDVVY